MSKKVFEELCAATGLAPTAGETEKQFAVRLCDGISKLSDGDFGKLSEPARKWFDDSVDPVNQNALDKIPALDGFVAPAAAAGAAPATPAPRRKTTAGAAAAAPAAAPATPAPAAKPETAAQKKKRVAKEKKAAADAKKADAKKADAKAKKEKAVADKKAAAQAKKDAAAAKKKNGTLPGMPEGSRARTDSVAFKVRRAVVLLGTDCSFEDALKKAGVTGEKRGGNGWNAYFNSVQVLRIAGAEKAYKKP